MLWCISWYNTDSIVHVSLYSILYGRECSYNFQYVDCTRMSLDISYWQIVFVLLVIDRGQLPSRVTTGWWTIHHAVSGDPKVACQKYLASFTLTLTARWWHIPRCLCPFLVWPKFPDRILCFYVERSFIALFTSTQFPRLLSLLTTPWLTKPNGSLPES